MLLRLSVPPCATQEFASAENVEALAVAAAAPPGAAGTAAGQLAALAEPSPPKVLVCIGKRSNGLRSEEVTRVLVSGASDFTS